MSHEYLSQVPDTPETLAVDAILWTLRTDPTLAQYGIDASHVWAPEGNRLQELPHYPEAAEMPVIRLLSWTYPTKWQDEVSHLGQLRLLFELIYLGSHYRDEMKLFTLFKNAIFPTRGSARQLEVAAQFEFPGRPTRERLEQLSTRTRSFGSDQFARITEAAYTMLFDVVTY